MKPNRLSVIEAARRLGCCQQMVREMLKKGCPFGFAFKGTKTQWVYFIFEDRFNAYISADEIESWRQEHGLPSRDFNTDSNANLHNLPN